MYLLPWPAIVAMTILALIVGVQRHRGSPGTIVLAIFSLPTIWVLLLGQLEGVALLGLLLMPWSVPVRLLSGADGLGAGSGSDSRYSLRLP